MVSFGISAKNSALQKTNIESIFQTIRTDDRIKGIIQTFRGLLQEGADGEIRSFKENLLPYFCLGTFKNNYRSKENLESIQYFMFDLDKLSIPQAEEFKTIISKDPRTYMAFISPSGNGVKFAFKTSTIITDQEVYTSNYVDIKERLEKEYKIKLDNTTDCSRATFFSYDEELYTNTNCKTIEIIDRTSHLPARVKVMKNFTIDEYNKKHSVSELLLKHGYSQDSYNPDRFKSPTSTTGTYGIKIFEDDTFFCHHTNDPLYTTDKNGKNYKFSAFDIFRILEHNGDYASALTASEEELNLMPNIIHVEDKAPGIDEETTSKSFYCFQEPLRGDYYVHDLYGLRKMEINALKAYYKNVNNGNDLPTCLNVHKIVYAPEVNYGVSEDFTTFNSWYESPVLKKAKELVKVGITKEECISNMPTLWVVMGHLFPETSELKIKIRDYVINYLSAVVKGYKVTKGIVLKDRGGTGKTMLFEYAMCKILGQNSKIFNTEMLSEKYNSWMSKKQLLVGVEINCGGKSGKDVADKLKILYTSDTLNIRRMQTDYFEESNCANMIICSNKYTPIEIDDTDRRLNIFTPGEEHKVTSGTLDSKPWHLENNPKWINLGVKSSQDGEDRAKAEAVYLASYLLLLETDYKKLDNIINTPERKVLLEARGDIYDTIAYKLKSRDYVWFLDNYEDKTGDPPAILESFENGLKTNKIEKNVLFKVVSRIINNKSLTKNILTKELKLRQIEEVRSHGRSYWTI